MTIDKHYIEESSRIIKLYNDVVNKLTVFEDTLKQNKDILLKLQSDIENLQNINNTDLYKKSKLFEIMSNYDKEIIKLQNIMMPYVSQLERLKKDSNNLYVILHEKYPGLTDKQLQDQIFKQLDEIKKSS